MEQRATVDITPQTDEENHTLLTDNQVRELASSHLEGALDTDVLSEKNYHIRSALQALVIAEQTVSADGTTGGQYPAHDAIVDAADAFDAVVMGETDPSLATFVFGVPADQVADRFLGLVHVVQREPTSTA